MNNGITEIEKQFFDTFGIEPNCKFMKYCDNCTKCGCFHYPRITPEILLELICLHNIYVWEVHTSTINELRNVLLGKYIEYVNLMADENEKQEYIHQVQALFKED